MRNEQEAIRSAHWEVDWGEWAAGVEQDRMMIETCCMKNHIKVEAFLQYLAAFVTEKRAIRYTPKSEADLRMHLLNWIRIQVEKSAQNGQKGKIARGKETVDRAAEMVKQRLRQGLYADDSH